MFTLTTHQKMAMARLVQRLVMFTRGITGKSNLARATRGGLHWELDLDEGIDFAIWLLGTFERSTMRTCRSLIAPGDCVVDIGANMGAHTLHLAEAVGSGGRVLAIEPTDFAFAKLQRNLALNPHLQDRVTAVQALLGDGRQQGPAPPVYSSWPLAIAPDAHPLHHGRLQSCAGAEYLSLDELLDRMDVQRVALIKIDVDGHETAVLRGARRTLERHHPHLVMELAPYVLTERGTSLQELLDLIGMDHYALIDVASGRHLPSSAPDIVRLIPEGGCRNVIALPIAA